MPTPSSAPHRGDQATRPTGAWAALLALTFVLLAIIALVATPWLGAHASRASLVELTDVVAPARGLVTRINASLAIEGTLLRDYLTSRDPRLTVRYHEAWAVEQRATRSLQSLVATSRQVHEVFDAFRAMQRAWHERIDSLLRDPGLANNDPLRGRDYESLLGSVVRLDEALESAGNARREELRRLDRQQGRIAIILGAVAAGASLATGWLARGMRRYATILEQRSLALERATASRARLMRGVTHDLKNPLQVIDGHAQLLADGIHGPLAAEQRDSVERIRRASGDMLTLIGDLLDLARAEAGVLPVRPHLVDLRQLTAEVVAEYHSAARRASVSLSFRQHPGELPAVTDPARVRQVLGNLLSNAVKYTPAGGNVTVAIGEQTPDPDSPTLLAIDVSNTGAGIPEDRQQAIFSEFTRLDAHLDIPGAGLGLSIARQVAGLLGGDLTLRSRPGGGAVFTFMLPRDRRGPPGRREAGAMA
jgi:signal transduction histidine kinase